MADCADVVQNWRPDGVPSHPPPTTSRCGAPSSPPFLWERSTSCATAPHSANAEHAASAGAAAETLRQKAASVLSARLNTLAGLQEGEDNIEFANKPGLRSSSPAALVQFSDDGIGSRCYQPLKVSANARKKFLVPSSESR